MERIFRLKYTIDTASDGSSRAEYYSNYILYSAANAIEAAKKAIPLLHVVQEKMTGTLYRIEIDLLYLDEQHQSGLCNKSQSIAFVSSVNELTAWYEAMG